MYLKEATPEELEEMRRYDGLGDVIYSLDIARLGTAKIGSWSDEINYALESEEALSEDILSQLSSLNELISQLAGLLEQIIKNSIRDIDDLR